MTDRTTNYRARRLYAYNHAEALCRIIDALGSEDGTQLPIPDHEMPKAPSDTVKRELKNQVAALLRTILAHNDGVLSPQSLPTF
ncbi:hypothetical protein ACVWXO_008060 [Bradyrhizobium sp. LM2.7]